MPWLLWTVIAHAKRSGSWLISALIFRSEKSFFYVSTITAETYYYKNCGVEPTWGCRPSGPRTRLRRSYGVRCEHSCPAIVWPGPSGLDRNAEWSNVEVNSRRVEGGTHLEKTSGPRMTARVGCRGAVRPWTWRTGWWERNSTACSMLKINRLNSV